MVKSKSIVSLSEVKSLLLQNRNFLKDLLSEIVKNLDSVGKLTLPKVSSLTILRAGIIFYYHGFPREARIENQTYMNIRNGQIISRSILMFDSGCW